MAKKVTNNFGNFLPEILSPRTFKNRTIWSHWRRNKLKRQRVGKQAVDDAKDGVDDAKDGTHGDWSRRPRMNLPTYLSMKKWGIFETKNNQYMTNSFIKARSGYGEYVATSD